MTEKFEQIEDRLISGLGILQIPQDKEYRAFRIYVDIIREPDPDYLNFKYNPERGNYCNIAYMHDGYVRYYDTVEFDKQEFLYYPRGVEAYIATALACLFQIVFDKLDTLLTAAGIPPVPGSAEPVPIEPVIEGLTEILFSCRDSTALQVRLFGLKDDIACPEGEPTPKEPPELPPPLPPVPSDAGIEVSPPYDRDTSDDGNTKPFNEDTVPPPLIPDFPTGEECAVYLVTLTWEPTTAGNVGNFSFICYGEIADIYVEPAGTNIDGEKNGIIHAVHRGQDGGSCGDLTDYSYGLWSIDTFTSITLSQ
jgi:hypothetical protein